MLIYGETQGHTDREGEKNEEEEGVPMAPFINPIHSPFQPPIKSTLLIRAWTIVYPTYALGACRWISVLISGSGW